jgi:hypothetical protein
MAVSSRTDADKEWQTVNDGVMGLTGLAERMRFRGWVGWVAGAVSGALAGWRATRGASGRR